MKELPRKYTKELNMMYDMAQPKEQANELTNVHKRL